MNYFYSLEFISLVAIAILVFWNISLRNSAERRKDHQRRKSAEQKLKESEEKFRTLFEMAPMLLNSFEQSESGACLLWNKECEKVFGYSLEELNAAPDAMALFYPDEKIRAQVLESFDSDDSPVFKEWRPMTKHSKQLITMWANVRLPNGELISVGYDVTQQRKSESIVIKKTKQLHEAQKKLSELNASLEQRVNVEVEKNRQQQKMMIQQSRHAQMGEILSMIAHQWRHPLNNLSLIIQDAVLQYKLDKLDDEAVSKFNVNSSKQIKQMSNTITGFKDFFKPDKNAVEFLVSQSINQAVEIIEPMLEVNAIKLIIETQADALIIGYPTELGQSIVNILSNAKDALMENEIEDKSIRLLLRAHDDEISIVIRDNAGGIADNIVEKIFDPYFSTKSEQHGTGLGLYITKIIVEEHMKGKLSVYNHDSGAVFSITFKLS